METGFDNTNALKSQTVHAARQWTPLPWHTHITQIAIISLDCDPLPST